LYGVGDAVALDLPNDDCAPAEARAFVSAWADGQLADQQRDNLLLLVSELVTNVVRWAHTDARLFIVLRGRSVHVEVTDWSMLQPRTCPTPGPDGGYGLRLVDALANQWGTRQFDGGKTVWFEL
jgi:anti-sigma regulatory factor (Ser/Thr protein kinase)